MIHFLGIIGLVGTFILFSSLSARFGEERKLFEEIDKINKDDER